MNEWISTKDRLPSPHERVLLLRTTGKIRKMIVGFYANDNFWYDIDDLWDSPLINITHWLPLPDEPKATTRNVFQKRYAVYEARLTGRNPERVDLSTAILSGLFSSREQAEEYVAEKRKQTLKFYYDIREITTDCFSD